MHITLDDFNREPAQGQPIIVSVEYLKLLIKNLKNKNPLDPIILGKFSSKIFPFLQYRDFVPYLMLVFSCNIFQGLGSRQKLCQF